jgi:hypothetical protein
MYFLHDWALTDKREVVEIWNQGSMPDLKKLLFRRFGNRAGFSGRNKSKRNGTVIGSTFPEYPWYTGFFFESSFQFLSINPETRKT